MRPVFLSRRAKLGCLVAVAVFAMFVYLMLKSPPDVNVAISFAGFTNSPVSGRIALMQVVNNGDCTVRRLERSTIYWTNAMNVTTNTFISLAPSNVLRPGASEILQVQSPAPNPWEASVHFMIEPGVIDQVRAANGWWISIVAGRRPSTHSVYVRTTPAITAPP
jgi:hypothetical protein